MDGESLEALLTADKGPDCLKDLIPKLGVRLGVRLRVYKRIKSLCFNQAGAPANQVQAALVSDASYSVQFKFEYCIGSSQISDLR